MLHLQTSSMESRWLSNRSMNLDSALRLFCGGNAGVYRGWQSFMPPGVEVCPIQLPGRANRLNERPMTRLFSIVENLCADLQPYLDRPFALFGHSMGALIAFELARRIRDSHHMEPVHLFVSGRSAPEVADARKDYELPDAEFIAVLQGLNGTPKEILQSPEALSLLLPVIRADFEVTQTYAYRHGSPLKCPIKALGGIRDTCTPPDSMRGWKAQTAGAFSLSILPGDHFFIAESRAQVLAITAHELGRALL
jgi:surfactin synthase thioesterase subunit